MNNHRTQRAFQHLALMAIVLLGGAMRLADLGNRPYGLFRDEAEKGYNAWALARSGGAVEFSGGLTPGPPIAWRRLPWMINVMGGKTSAIYQYVSAPVVAIGGLNVTTTRLAAALVGTLTVALAGWVAWAAWGGWAAMAAALCLAISPWHLNFSRWALEGIFVPFFIVLTLGGLLGLERGRRWGAPLAGAALGGLFYSYSGAQPFVAAWGLILAGLYWRKLSWRAWPCWLGVALFLIPVIPTLLVRLGPGGSSRLGAIAIWNAPGATPLSIAARFLKNFLAHFDPRFLFICGDLQPRHNVAGGGELLLPEVLLIPLGLFFIFRRRAPLRWALAGALLCGPLPAAITRDGIPHALRSFPMVVPLMLWAGLGMAGGAGALLGAFRNRKAVRPAYGTALLLILIAGYLAAGGYHSFYRCYWTNAASDPAAQVAFEAGARQAWATVARNRRPGQRVFVNGYIPYAPYYQAFYFKLDPRSLARRGLEDGGFYYYNPGNFPATTVEQLLAPGDWLIQGAPSRTLARADGRPLLPPSTRRRVDEAWVWTKQRPPQ